MDTKVKSGFVTILGKPNAGKSTLMNLLLGQKLSIITNKPQTTRKRILGILTGENHQIIFLDTPGILHPGYLLQEKMMEHVSRSVKDADVFILMIDLEADPDAEKTITDSFIDEFLKRSKKPILLLLNKIDLSNEEKVKYLINKFEETKKFKKIIPASATLGFNTQQIVPAILDFLPDHPKYFPDDIVADENERFFVSEIIREKILEQYHEEIPYSCEVLIVDFKEREAGKNFIQAEVIVEKESQKGIIIGKGGASIKRLGEHARTAIEEFLQRSVYLDLRVKVRDKWRSNERMLRSFGYTTDKE
ncbi:MAG: GTPase Era [Ignavibacteriaceae bacterium]